MANQWFRFYSEALNDPKVQSLEPELFKHWVNLLCVSCNNNGTLPETFQQIAFLLRVTENAAITVVERLHNATLIDRVNGGANGYRYAIHSWDKRQYKSDTSTDRVKRFRAVTRNVTVTPPEQIQNRTDTEQIKVKDNTEVVLSKKSIPRKTRLPEDWGLPQEWGDWAESQGLTGDEILKQAEKFKDRQISVGAAYSDWKATWRNWIRNHIEWSSKNAVRTN